MQINKNKSKKDKVKKGKGSKQDEPGQPVKRRKYLTAACDFCKHRKVKCDGNHPCAFCVTKGQECIYSQRAKRGRRPENKNTNETKIVFEKNEAEEDEILPTAEDAEISGTTENAAEHETKPAQDSASLVSELELYTVAERTWAVGEFSRSARGWAAELVEVDVVTRPVSLAQQAQLYAILAHTIRVNADAHKAEVYFQEATQLVKQVFDEVSVDAARAMFLVGFYVPLTGVNPKAHIYFSLCATLAKSLSSYDVTMRRTYGLAIIMAIMADSDSSAKQKHARLLRHIEEHGNMGGTYEKTQTLIAKIYSFIALKFNNFWDINNLSRIKEINFTREEQDSLMEALTYGETLAINNLSELSVGLVVLFKIYKVLVLWRSGDPRAAEEALECINFCENSSVAIFFAPDIMTLMVLVLCLEETTSPSGASITPSPTAHMARDFVRRLCIANGQQEYLPYLSAPGSLSATLSSGLPPGLASISSSSSPFSPTLPGAPFGKFSPAFSLPSPLQFDVSSPAARTFPQSPPLLMHQHQQSKNERKQEKVNERERQIHALQHQLDEMRKNEIQTLQQHVEHLRENEISTLHRQIDDMRKIEIQMLQQEIENMRKVEIQTLQHEVETMRKGEMQTLQQQVQDLQRQVRALQLVASSPAPSSPPLSAHSAPAYLPTSPAPSSYAPSPQVQQFPIQVYHSDLSNNAHNSNISNHSNSNLSNQSQHTLPQYSSNILQQHMSPPQQQQTNNILHHTQNFPHLHDTPNNLQNFQQHHNMMQSMPIHFAHHEIFPSSLHPLSSSSELPLLDDLLSFNFA